jgi:hypothetical protein
MMVVFDIKIKGFFFGLEEKSKVASPTTQLHPRAGESLGLSSGGVILQGGWDRAGFFELCVCNDNLVV